MEKLTAEQRQEIARHAVQVRWASKGNKSQRMSEGTPLLNEPWTRPGPCQCPRGFRGHPNSSPRRTLVRSEENFKERVVRPRRPGVFWTARGAARRGVPRAIFPAFR